MITLAELRAQSRDRADMANSQFISDSELNNYINASIAELHDILIATYDADYYIKTTTFSTVAGTSDYALPSDFYKIRGVDSRLGTGRYITLSPFNFNERNSKSSLINFVTSGNYFRYRLVGDNISFYPAPDGVYDIKLWYTPLSVKLSADTDTLNDYNQYSEFVITDAAIKMGQKEEADVQILIAQKAELKRRIQTMAQNRDSGKPDSISDIYAENLDHLQFYD